MNEKANYGNWVPEKALYMLFGAVIVLGVIAVAVQVALSEMVIAIIVGVLCILTLVMAIYMLICHEAFAFGKGNYDAEALSSLHIYIVSGCMAVIQQWITGGFQESEEEVSSLLEKLSASTSAGFLQGK